MITESQQRIIDSLVNEFEKMNKPTSSNSGGLVDWDSLNSAKDKWLQTKRDIELSNEAMRKLIQQTIDDTDVKIRESLGHLFEIKSRMFDEIENGCNWEFKHHRRIDYKAFSISLGVRQYSTYSNCGNFSVYALKTIEFSTYAGNPNSELRCDTIEELFQHERVINTIMKYI
jgi:hypothetical protein